MNFSFKTSEGNSFTISELPGMLALYGAGHYQYFANEKNVRVLDLAKLMPTDAAIVELAQLHKKGRVDKDRFTEAVVQHKKLSAVQRAALVTFITTCDCSPATVVAKLRMMGYGAYTSYQYPGGLNLAAIAPPPPDIIID